MDEVHFKQINQVTGPEKEKHHVSKHQFEHLSKKINNRISGYGGQVRGNGGNVAKILDM